MRLPRNSVASAYAPRALALIWASVRRRVLRGWTCRTALIWPPSCCLPRSSAPPRVCARNPLANRTAAAGSLAAGARFASGGNGVSGFLEIPAVVDGVADLFVALYGEAGKHARSVVAEAGMPRNPTAAFHSVVELEA